MTAFAAVVGLAASCCTRTYRSFSGCTAVQQPACSNLLSVWLVLLCRDAAWKAIPGWYVLLYRCTSMLVYFIPGMCIYIHTSKHALADCTLKQKNEHNRSPVSLMKREKKHACRDRCVFSFLFFPHAGEGGGHLPHRQVGIRLQARGVLTSFSITLLHTYLVRTLFITVY